MSTSPLSFPRDKTRHTAMKSWCDHVGVPSTNIPAEPGALVVAPINEGELEAVFTEFVRRADGSRIIDHADCVPGDHHCGGYLRRDQHTRLVVTDAPPGFALPSWDAYAYVQFGPTVDLSKELA